MWVNINAYRYYFLLVDQSSPTFFAQRWRGCSWYVLFQFLSGRSVPEIIAIKVENCQKLCQILEVFVLPHSWGWVLQKLYQCTRLSHLPRSTSCGSFVRLLPLTPIVRELTGVPCTPLGVNPMHILLYPRGYSAEKNHVNRKNWDARCIPAVCLNF